MTRQTRRRFSPEYKQQAVARLLAPGATQASVAAELGVTPTQLKTWRLELEAAGSASAIERQQAEAGELVRLRQDNKRLKEEVEVLRKASAFFAQGRRRHEREARLHRRPQGRACRTLDVPGSRRVAQLVSGLAASGPRKSRARRQA